MHFLKLILKKLRHNILVYMMWDVPNDRIKQAGKDRSRREKLIAIAQFSVLFMGLAFANKWYTKTELPPPINELKKMEAELIKVMRKTGKGGARKIKVKDTSGREWVFPKGGNYLRPLHGFQLTELEQNCLHKPIELYWTSEPYLFVGHLTDIWLMKDCEGEVLINYARKARARFKNIQKHRKIVLVSILLACFASMTYLRNYELAVTRLKRFRRKQLTNQRKN